MRILRACSLIAVTIVLLGTRAVLAAPAVAAPAKPVPPVPARGDLRTRALGLLTSWVDAQNRADTPAYVALYDQPHFHGRKRTLRGVTQLDWKAWAQDRGAMMKRRPTVAAEAPTVESWLDPGTKLKPGIVRLRFLQRWKSARYADHGIKVLDLLYDPRVGSLKIIHEDLLNSELGWEDRAPGSSVLKLGTISTAEEAERGLSALQLTAGNVSSTLAALPDAPQLRRALALAILQAGDLACDRIVNESQCGEEVIEWAALDPQLAWPDPCVRRRAALWAFEKGGLSPAELGLLIERLESYVALAEPERELPEAVMAAATALSDELRLRLLRAAVLGKNAELAARSTQGLSPASIATCANDLHLDPAALALDPSTQRKPFLAALRDDKLEVETRMKLVERTTDLHGKDLDEVLRDVSDHAASCALSTAAAVVLTAHHDPSRLPHKPKGTTDPDTLSRELCRLVHDPDRARAELRWLEFIPRRGKVQLTEEEHNDFAERDESGARIENEIPARTIDHRSTTLSDLDPRLGEGELPSCSGLTCQVQTSSGNYSVRFEDGYIVELHLYRWVGCPC